MLASDLLEHVLALLPHTSSRGETVKFLAVPGHGAPRWLLQDKAGGLDAVLANWSPYRLSARLKWKAVGGAHRLHVLKYLPPVDTVELTGVEAIDWPALGWNGAAPPKVAAYVGTPGPAQKLVLHLVDPGSRRCEAVVKTPLAAGAHVAILREAATLATLAGDPRAPRLLRLDRARGISTQQFLAGKPGSRRLRPEYFELLRSLVLPGEDTSLAACSAAWKPEALGPLVPESEADLLQAALTELEDQHELPSCWVHGDFAPWNIRQRPNLAPALIDWEEAYRGGLPLHDAYHFLHIQDFLFGGKPTPHAAALAPFARTLGVTPQQCRKLEIAYLAQAYLQCRRRDGRSRAAFLITSLAQAVGQCADKRSRRASLSRPVLSANGTDARAELFDALVEGLNSEGLAYCVLSGCEKAPGNGEPDVDLMLRAQDQRRIPDLLARVARSTGALLVQSIQHETSACYFILARPEGKQIAHLDVDCYSDYRKQARTWLRADDVIADRQTYRGFYVPSVPDEFTYYLIKKVLKQSITSHQLTRLQHLLARNQAECCARIARFWPAESPLLQQAITGHDLAWLQQRLPALHRELRKSRPVEDVLRRCAAKLYEFARLASRAANPTGMWVEIAEGDAEQRIQLAGELVSRLASAFRHTRTMLPMVGHNSLAKRIEVLAARIRSTLVVSADDDLGMFRRLTRCFGHPDLVLVLSAREIESTPRMNTKRRIVHLCTTEDSEEIVQSACDAVLQWLASRLQKRLNLPHSPLVPRTRASGAQQAELSAVGSD